MAQQPHAATAARPLVPAAMKLPRAAAESALPEGWEIAEYASKGGKLLYAVYSQGRRLASGMPSEQSATRWARLLAASHLWPVA